MIKRTHCGRAIRHVDVCFCIILVDNVRGSTLWGRFLENDFFFHFSAALNKNPELSNKMLHKNNLGRGAEASPSWAWATSPPPLPTPRPLFETILHRDDHEQNLVNSILPHNTINRLTLRTNQREFLLTISIQYQTDKWQE